MFSSEPTKIKAIRPGDDDFIITDGLMIDRGWIKPIAYQPVHEEFMEKLTK